MRTSVGAYTQERNTEIPRVQNTLLVGSKLRDVDQKEHLHELSAHLSKYLLLGQELKAQNKNDALVRIPKYKCIYIKKQQKNESLEMSMNSHASALSLDFD